MAEENKVIVKIPTDSAKKSLSDLKKEIQSMTNELVNLEKGTKEYSETLTAIAERQHVVDQATKDVKDAIQAVREETERLNSANQAEQKTQASLQADVKKYKNELKGLERGSEAYIETIDKIVTTQAELDQITADLKNATNEYKNSLIDANESQNLNIVTTQSLGKEIGELKNMLLNLDQGSEAYIATLDELNAKQERLNAVNKDIAGSTVGVEDTFLDLGKTASAAAGGFAVAQGALKLLGIESEGTAKAMVTLQASIALVAGMKPLIDGIKSSDVSFKSLNATIKANPLIWVTGLIIGLVAAAVKLEKEFSFITDEIGDLWGSIKELLPSLDSVKNVVSGVGTAITRNLLAPIKAAVKAIQGDFSGAVEEFKRGADVIGNYNDGFAKQSDKNKKKFIENFKEQNNIILNGIAERLKLQIETNESMYGSDYRYTKDGAVLYETYYNTLAAMQDKNGADYERAMNNLRNFQRQNSERAASEQQKIFDEQRKSADDARKKREADEKAEKDKQIAAEKEYAKTIEAINKETLKNITDAYTGDDRKKFLLDSINLNYQLAESAKRTADDENALWTERSAAASQYRAILNENYNLEKEYDTLIEQQRLKDEEYRLKTEALNQEISDFSKSETPDQQLERLAIEMDINETIAKSTENSLEIRAAAWRKYIKTREQYDKVDAKIKEDEKKRLQASLQATADFLDASTALVGENSVAQKAMAVASAVINTYLGATMALASYPPPASYIAMAATIVAGLATVAKIMSTKIPGASDTSGAVGAESAAMPSMPEMDSNFVETHNNMDVYDEERLNTTQAVLVVEDVNQAQTRVRTVEDSATY